MSDHLVYEDSVSTELYTTSEFVSKQYLYVNDNNNGSYSSQIVLDTTSLSNSGQWINYQEAFLLMPLVLQFECSGGNLPTGCLDWVAGLKNGYWQMIDSMTVQFNNTTVVQQVPFLNVFSSFKAMTSWGKEDIKNWGAICGFYPDTAESWIYNNIKNSNANPSANPPVDATFTTNNLLNTSGTGICNNRNCEYVQINNFLSAFGAGVLTDNNGAIPFSYNINTKCTNANVSARHIFNCGLQKRQSWINFASNLTATGTPSDYVYQLSNALADGADNGFVGSFSISSVSSNQSALVPFASYNTVFQASITTTTSAVVDVVIQIPAVIRLKDICGFFEKVPLLKGSTMRIYINTNQCYFQAQYINGQLTSIPTADGTPSSVNQTSYGAVSLVTSPYILGGGHTNPIMLASMDLGQGGYNVNPLQLADSSATATANPIAATVVNVKFAVSIVKNQFANNFSTSTGTGANCPITQCRLYAPAYTMNPLAETRFLELTPTKKILYNDILQYTFPNQSNSSMINILVSNGVPNIKQVVVVPFISQNYTNGAANNVAYNSMVGTGNDATSIGVAPTQPASLLSPFSTSGATPDPITLTNFQILISGTTLFIQQLQYNYENFYEQMVSINQLNGSVTTGLGSGLVGYDEWQYLYRYYVGNASRILPSEEGMARSVQVQCTNTSAVPIDLMVFIVYEKEVTINMATGQLIA